MNAMACVSAHHEAKAEPTAAEGVSRSGFDAFCAIRAITRRKHLNQILRHPHRADRAPARVALMVDVKHRLLPPAFAGPL